MDIFESLENLNVSEECFDDILGIVEELLSENTEDYALAKAYKTKDKGERERLLNLSDKALEIRKAARKAMGNPDRTTKKSKRIKKVPK